MPKQVIDVSRPQDGDRAFMIYGPSGAGKTRFAATFPRPLFLSDRSEKGWETIAWMSDDDFYEKGRRPEVWAIGKPAEMVEALSEVETIVKKDKQRFRTLVVDQLTHYADAYFSELEMLAYQNAKGKRPDSRQLYNDLASHLRYLMLRVHELPLNIVWVCLPKEPDPERGIPGGPLISGRTAVTAPAKCNYWFYCRSYSQNDGTVVHEVRTRQFGAYPARGRDGNTLPDPMPPSYRAFEEALAHRLNQAAPVAAAK